MGAHRVRKCLVFTHPASVVLPKRKKTRRDIRIDQLVRENRELRSRLRKLEDRLKEEKKGLR